MIKIIIATLLLCSQSIFASDSLAAWQAFQVSTEVMNEKNIVVKFDIAPEYHLYQDKIKFTNIGDSSVKLGEPLWPETHTISSPNLGPFKVYSGKTNIIIPVNNVGHGKLKLQINYQGCKGLSLCYPGQESIQTLDLNPSDLTHIDSNATNATSVVTPQAHPGFFSQLFSANTNSAAIVKSLAQNSWLVVIGFFGLGLLIAFTPCVFPLFPILIAVISGKDVSTRRSFSLATSYVLGGATTYAIAGVLAASLGYGLSSVLQSTWVSIILAMFFLLFALSLFGVYNLQLPSGLQNKINQVVNRKSGGSLLSAFVIGGLSNLILSPCVTAPLAGALIYISTTGNRALGGAALFALGLGSGLPLLIIAVLGKKFLPKNGNWVLGVKYFLGHLMLGMAIYMASKFLLHEIVLGIIASWVTYIIIQIIEVTFLHKYKIQLFRGISGDLVVIGVIAVGISVTMLNPTKPENTQFKVIAQTNIELDQAIEQAKHAGKPILIDYYAKWCVACMEMELQTFSDPKVIQVMQNYSLIRVDVTKNNHEVDMLEKRYNIIAPPTIVFLDSKAKEQENYRITGFIGKNKLAQSLEEIIKFSVK